MNRRLVLSVLLSLAIVPTASSADLPVAKPESAGMSSERLARIDTWLHGIVERKEAAGFVSLVARHGKVVHHKAIGKRGLEVAEPMPINALFDLASMTKPITVVAALMLLEEGRYTLTDPITNFVPEYRSAKVETAPGTITPVKRPIRVKDLFTHTSGVFDPWSRAEAMAFPTLAAYTQALSEKPLRYEPGSTWLYGASHHVLGYLVQQASGVPLDRLIQDKVLTPLAARGSSQCFSGSDSELSHLIFVERFRNATFQWSTL